MSKRRLFLFFLFGIVMIYSTHTYAVDCPTLWGKIKKRTGEILNPIKDVDLTDPVGRLDYEVFDDLDLAQALTDPFWATHVYRRINSRVSTAIRKVLTGNDQAAYFPLRNWPNLRDRINLALTTGFLSPIRGSAMQRASLHLPVHVKFAPHMLIAIPAAMVFPQVLPDWADPRGYIQQKGAEVGADFLDQRSEQNEYERDLGISEWNILRSNIILHLDSRLENFRLEYQKSERTEDQKAEVLGHVRALNLNTNIPLQIYFRSPAFLVDLNNGRIEKFIRDGDWDALSLDEVGREIAQRMSLVSEDAVKEQVEALKLALVQFFEPLSEYLDERTHMLKVPDPKSLELQLVYSSEQGSAATLALRKMSFENAKTFLDQEDVVNSFALLVQERLRVAGKGDYQISPAAKERVGQAFSKPEFREGGLFNNAFYKEPFVSDVLESFSRKEIGENHASRLIGEYLQHRNTMKLQDIAGTKLWDGQRKKYIEWSDYEQQLRTMLEEYRQFFRDFQKDRKPAAFKSEKTQDQKTNEKVKEQKK